MNKDFWICALIRAIHAAVSSLPKHSAVMLTEEGEYIKSECFEHEA